MTKRKWVPCTICKHPKRAEIDTLLQDKNNTIKEIAEAYEIREHSLQNHRIKHLGIRLQALHRFNKKKAVVVNRGATLATQLPAPTFGPAAGGISIREISKDQKQRIRDMLDQYFDTDSGTYKEGWSDQKVGTKLDIAWRAVYNIRELAYGPITAHPLKGRLDQLSSRLDAIENIVRQLRKELNQLNNQILGEHKQAAPPSEANTASLKMA